MMLLGCQGVFSMLQLLGKPDTEEISEKKKRCNRLMYEVVPELIPDFLNTNIQGVLRELQLQAGEELDLSDNIVEELLCTD